nr:hypothetical protein [uncultured Cellulosilyticum sp.]
MKNKVLTACLISSLLVTPVAANKSISEPIHSHVMAGYDVGYVIEDGTVLDGDMHMWNVDGTIEGWYVAFNMEDDSFYYITQEAAQEFEKK